ncbi:MAG: rhomboid family intramembrane serine protease [Deltaproteobacteria bacterium]|nr:rhomboid family intramembrane serine protease [Deltaproteobacteria bacterium]
MQRRSILCPNCRLLISGDEKRCPYCGTPNPNSPWRRVFSLALLNDPRLLLKALFTVNIAFFILSILLDPMKLGLSANPLTFFSPSSNGLFLLGATGSIPIDRFGRWWTLITASYLHGGILHIFFNMMALRQLAPFVTREFGISRFVIVYALTGIAGFYVSYLAGVAFTIGASASLCGLIGAALYYGKSRGGPYGQAVYRQVMGWVVGLILFGFLVPGINNWAHGGGLIGGIAAGFLLGYEDRKREESYHRIAAIVLLLCTAAALLWAVVQALVVIFRSF